MFLKYTFALFTFFYLLPSYDCVKCKRTYYDTNSTYFCNGDYCVVRTNGKNPDMFGCISGYRYIQPGCFEYIDGSVSCFCNNSDLCSDSLHPSNATKTKIQTIECFAGSFRDGKVVENKTCVGNLCSYSVSTDFNFNGKISINFNCMRRMDDNHNPYFKGKGCAKIVDPLSPNFITWECVCDTKFCNTPSAFTVSNTTGNVTCALQSMQEAGITLNGTCRGDYCYTIDRSFPTVMGNKLNLMNLQGTTQGCMSISNGTANIANKYSMEYFGIKESVDICQKDLCNKT